MKNLKKKRIASGIVGVSIVSMLSGFMFPAVANAETSQSSYEFVPNDSLFEDQWALDTDHLNLQSVLGLTIGKGQTIAVLDTGITPHADLDDNVLPGYDMVSNEDYSGDGNGRDSDPTDSGDYVIEGSGTCGQQNPSPSTWHGTRVAGIAAARGDNNIGMIGVAPGANILPVRISDRCSAVGNISDMSDAILWAVGEDDIPGTVKNQNPATVINISTFIKNKNFSIRECPTEIQAAINKAVNEYHVPVVVAAGNDRKNTAIGWPANCENVINVAAYGKDFKLSSYSNFGMKIDIVAPGGDQTINAFNSDVEADEGLVVTSNGSETSPEEYSGVYPRDSGTSLAAPHVAGTIALMRSLNPVATPSDIELVLKQNATTTPTCDPYMCGAGNLNLKDSVLAMKTASSPLTSTFAFTPYKPWIYGPELAGAGDFLYAYSTSYENDYKAWGPVETEMTYQWLRNGTPILGATEQVYEIQQDDVFTTLSVKITASKLGYATVSRTSDGFYVN